jgi:hypothetical protein
MMILIVTFRDFVNAFKNSERFDVLSFVPEEYVKKGRIPVHDVILECCNKYLLSFRGPVFFSKRNCARYINVSFVCCVIQCQERI